MILGATDRVDDFPQHVIAVLQDTDHPNGSLRSALCRLRRPCCELVEIDGDELSASPRADGGCKEISSLAHELMSGYGKFENIEMKEMAAAR